MWKYCWIYFYDLLWKATFWMFSEHIETDFLSFQITPMSVFSRLSAKKKKKNF